MKALPTTLLLLLSVLLAGCGTTPPATTPVHTTERVVERLVAVPLPADSALLTAYLACDSLNKVQLIAFAEQKTAGISTAVQLDNNRLRYHSKTVRDTVRVPVIDSMRYKEVPVYVDVVREVNALSGWQWFQVWAGRIALLLAALWVLKTYLITI